MYICASINWEALNAVGSIANAVGTGFLVYVALRSLPREIGKATERAGRNLEEAIKMTADGLREGIIKGVERYGYIAKRRREIFAAMPDYRERQDALFRWVHINYSRPPEHTRGVRDFQLFGGEAELSKFDNLQEAEDIARLAKEAGFDVQGPQEILLGLDQKKTLLVTIRFPELSTAHIDQLDAET